MCVYFSFLDRATARKTIQCAYKSFLRTIATETNITCCPGPFFTFKGQGLRPRPSSVALKVCFGFNVALPLLSIWRSWSDKKIIRQLSVASAGNPPRASSPSFEEPYARSTDAAGPSLRAVNVAD